MPTIAPTPKEDLPEPGFDELEGEPEGEPHVPEGEAAEDCEGEPDLELELPLLVPLLVSRGT